jgi:hypothetical protein
LQTAATAENLPRLLVAVSRLDAAENQAEVLARLLEECTAFASRAALLLVAEGDAGRLEVWNATGFGADLSGRSLAFPDALGELSSHPVVSAHAATELCQSLGAETPLAAVALPFVLRDEVRAVLYADRFEAGHAFDPAAVQLLCFIGAQIIETLPLRKKRPAVALASLATEPAVAIAGVEAPAALDEVAAAGVAAVPLGAAATPADALFDVDPAAPTPEPSAPVFGGAVESVTSFDESFIPPSERRTETLSKPSFTPPHYLRQEPPAERPDVDALDALAEIEGEDADEVDVGGTVTFPSAQWDSGAIEVGGDSMSLEVSPDELATLMKPPAAAPSGSAVETGPSDGAAADQGRTSTVEVPVPKPPPGLFPELSGVWELDAESPATPATSEGETTPPPPPGAAPERGAASGWSATPPPPTATPAAREASPFAGLTPSVEQTRSPFESLSGAAEAPPPVAPVRPFVREAPPLPPSPPRVVPAQPEVVAPAPAKKVPITKELGSEVRPPADAASGPGLAFKAAASAEEELHAEAKRLARLLISELKLYNEEEIEEGKRNGNIYRYLKDAIERSRVMYEERIDERVRTAEDYFYDELVRSVAGGDAKLLGI